jgi:hypothetical protein
VPKNKALLLLVVAWFMGLTGLVMGLVFDPLWFARFGSLVVLFSVMSEFSLLQVELRTLYGRLDQINAEDDIPDLSPSKWHRKKFRMTHVTIIIGTLIWGFGDLMLPPY